MNARKLTLAGFIAVFGSVLCATNAQITPQLSIRSQGMNTPRHLAGAVQQVYTVDRNTFYGTVSAALEYSRTFNHKQITKALFGNTCCPTLTISGSQIPNRGENDWLADYFYLPTDFKSTVNFKPVIDNILLDINFYVSLDNWTPGLYFDFYAPLVHSRWDLGFCETIELKGTNTQAPGYFSPATMQRNQLFNSFQDFTSGDIVQPFTQTVAGVSFPMAFQRLLNARMNSSRLNQTRLADIRVDFGYNPIRNEDYHFGAALYTSLPTGNRPEGEYLFDPIIGNGHHWELGGHTNAHYTFCQSEDRANKIILYLDAIISHLFSGRQKRTFDLQGKPFSRYMLMERLSTPITNNLKGNGTTPSAQFFNEYQPVANLSNLSVDVSATIQTELTAMLTFVYGSFSWDIGYNFWYRSCEKLNLRGINGFENNTSWALKGDAFVFGFDRGPAGNDPLIGAVPLSATQSNADINNGLNFTTNRSFADASKNPGIDNPASATGDGNGTVDNNPLSASPDTNLITIQTSLQPVFITTQSLNVCGQLSRGLSNKIFTHFSHEWKQYEHWQPYLGIGGQAEFALNGSDDCEGRCNNAISSAISQWSIWLKGGLTF